MDCFGPGFPGNPDDGIGAQVALLDRSRAKAVRLGGHGNMRRVRIGFGEDGHRAHTHRVKRPDDAAGDFPAVGDEDFGEHGEER